MKKGQYHQQKSKKAIWGDLNSLRGGKAQLEGVHAILHRTSAHQAIKFLASWESATENDTMIIGFCGVPPDFIHHMKGHTSLSLSLRADRFHQRPFRDWITFEVSPLALKGNHWQAKNKSRKPASLHNGSSVVKR